MKKRVLYGNANYEEVVSKNGYFVDKTAFIEPLEAVDNAVFLRPRRFGKSLWCRILECYYDIGRRDRFDELFGHTHIGRHPTPHRNACFVLSLDFSVVDPTGTLAEIEASFNHHGNLTLQTMVGLSDDYLKDKVAVDLEDSLTDNLARVLSFIREHRLPSLYLLIDEYDNFANQLITAHKDELYRGLTADDSFLKTFFKTIKAGRKTGAIAHVFITGVLPITMDDLASGFNIATYLTLDPTFENMLGFTQAELERLLDEVYADYGFDATTKDEVLGVMRQQYNGYHFVDSQGEALYNSTMVMYFLDQFTRHRKIPNHLTDLNLRTDLSWVKRITSAYAGSTEEFVGQLTTDNRMAFDQTMLTNQFSMSQFFQQGFFPISFFYLGLLTRLDPFCLRLPNLNMQQIFVQYFNELHQVDVSTRYAETMRRFVADLDVAALFTGYWREYVSQLPEAIFPQVNENFYRVTFMELCSRYLSRWFTWNVERSYPQGRSDLEFVGKFDECHAGKRIVVEFKYLSNAAFARHKTTPEEFPPQAEDARQLAGYVQGLRDEYPEVWVASYVIYCFGNQGCRVFRLADERLTNERLTDERLTDERLADEHLAD